jgi:hypothetical protein
MKTTELKTAAWKELRRQFEPLGFKKTPRHQSISKPLQDGVVDINVRGVGSAPYVRIEFYFRLRDHTVDRKVNEIREAFWGRKIEHPWPLMSVRGYTFLKPEQDRYGTKNDPGHPVTNLEDVMAVMGTYVDLYEKEIEPFFDAQQNLRVLDRVLSDPTGRESPYMSGADSVAIHGLVTKSLLGEDLSETLALFERRSEGYTRATIQDVKDVFDMLRKNPLG